jgi:tetratricopeptide (TPR) repeat protein
MALSRIAMSDGDAGSAQQLYEKGRVLKRKAAGDTSLGASTGMIIPIPTDEQRAKNQQLALPAQDAFEKERVGTTLSPEQREAIARQEAQLREVLGSSFNDWGTSEARSGDYKAALALFQKAQDWNPKQPFVMRNIGLAAFRLGQFDDSLNALKLAITNDPQDGRAQELFVQASLDWAQQLTKSGKLSQAAHVLEDAARIAPSRQDIHETLIAACEKLGRKADAMRHQQQLELLRSETPVHQ